MRLADGAGLVAVVLCLVACQVPGAGPRARAVASPDKTAGETAPEAEPGTAPRAAPEAQPAPTAAPSVAVSQQGEPPPSRVKVEHVDPVIIEYVRFEASSTKILPESEKVLAAVKEVLAAHPEIEVLRVEGHTDAQSDHSYDGLLSERRAAAVVRWLVSHGIDKQRLHAKGYGHDRPLRPSDTSEGQQANRRVEFHVVKTKRGTEPDRGGAD